MNYYNENDEQKAAWLRELIRANVIAPGEVDERSITDVRPEDLRGFVQCHFFAGIGVWSYALRLAGWPDDRPVWTGSCPCPSFSCAGKGRGFDDPRHLWPAWFGLIEVGRPATLFGEQADDAIGYGWLDLVQTDLEGAAYSVGKAVLGACSVGAPHIRQRLYFCAHTKAAEILARSGKVRAGAGTHQGYGSGNNGRVSKSPDTPSSRRQTAREHGSGSPLFSARSEQCGGVEFCGNANGTSATRFRADSRQNSAAEARLRHGSGDDGRAGNASPSRLSACQLQNLLGAGWREEGRAVAEPGPTSGFWRDCDWWYGRDGKYRPIEPGLFPLAHGVANRVLKLRGYGDAIVPQVAAQFIQASEEAINA